MVYRIEVDSISKSSEAIVLEKKFKNISIKVSNVYTIDFDFDQNQIQKIAESLHNPIVESVRINNPKKETFDYALELGFLPGVTDNVANTATEIINDLFKIEIGRNKVFTSKILFLSGNLTEKEVQEIAKELINVLIERYHIKSYDKYIENNGMDYTIPIVNLTEEIKVLDINLDVSDDKLKEIGKKGIYDPKTNEFRGPLALDMDYMNAIKTYFEKEGRNPTDIEIETIAQTWSEHCKHTIFAGSIDDNPKGIYSSYIKAATNEIRKQLDKKDFCLSVFKDNSGAIVFDDEYMITHKAETHNSPSALDPFGGAITGIVGVNRDTLGFGLGALPIANIYGYCLGRPEDKDILYRGKGQESPVLLPKRIMDGVIAGVNVGGNCSGIPTPNGFMYIDDCYKGKPLVFVGTVGLIPRILPDGRRGEEKKANIGDNIVMIGGRVGKDGIHGATFSSEALTKGSPATAVQIGDPITQKKLSDAIAKEARDLNLYTCITDNGAGGLSSSVAEMAEDTGGFELELEQVPLKYPGLQPWEIWISESQERMTLAINDEQLPKFQELMKNRGVESTVIGKFTDSGRAVINHNGKKILDIEMDFLHNGLPKRQLKTSPYEYNLNEPTINVENQNELFTKILGNHNNSSNEWISKQYDHEVQNNSVIKPLQGKGRVNGCASVIRPVITSKKGAILSQALHPRLSEISCYDMAACSIDESIRNCVARGGNVNHMALMDNFCWCSSNDPKRLGQLLDSAKACYKYAVDYKTPFISGKDSMFNDFKGFDKDDNILNISVLPTLLISSIGVIDDINKVSSFDFKVKGDLIYVLGKTKDECGGSDLYHEYNEVGGIAPKVDSENARKLYEKVYDLHQKELLSSCMSINSGGIAISLAKMAIAGRLGTNINLANVPSENLDVTKILYSETQSRFIVTIDPNNKDAFETEMKDFVIGEIGTVTENDFKINNNDEKVIDLDISKLEQIYKERFGGY